ncbi:hypothetical protein BGW36DRAFT_188979 [Talaromyces proteolyticus]|uniref:Uncharacterized protein n=1 Tax=Talaromyces proteolyticus TaxID=1131652 RepID=A0AAD4KV37_9EURO|nr:uncharacterized protein BGW36DRAFT_188979 [Talaromyces proteolyticus]KAH8696599.1 hypothetical protein BGW36DRAFT_188979 [Talaromyces proteolyticus]
MWTLVWSQATSFAAQMILQLTGPYLASLSWTLIRTNRGASYGTSFDTFGVLKSVLTRCFVDDLEHHKLSLP